MALSDSAIRKAKPADKPIRLFDGGGLYLEISPSGSKLWRLKYRFAGKEKRLALGIYPDVSLAGAREAPRRGAPTPCSRDRPRRAPKGTKDCEGRPCNEQLRGGGPRMARQVFAALGCIALGEDHQATRERCVSVDRRATDCRHCPAGSPQSAESNRGPRRARYGAQGASELRTGVSLRRCHGAHPQRPLP